MGRKVERGHCFRRAHAEIEGRDFREQRVEGRRRFALRVITFFRRFREQEPVATARGRVIAVNKAMVEAGLAIVARCEGNIGHLGFFRSKRGSFSSFAQNLALFNRDLYEKETIFALTLLPFLISDLCCEVSPRIVRIGNETECKGWLAFAPLDAEGVASGKSAG